MATDILPEPRDQLGTTTHFSSVAIIRVIPDAIDWGKRVYHKMRSTVFLFSSINTHFQPRAAAQSTAIAIAPITPNSPTTPEMFPFIPFQAFVPPVIMVPVREQWTSTLDIRKSRESRTGKRMALGNGACHHDFISFSFADDKNPPDETLVVMHPVTTRHYIDLQTEKLKALFEVLADLQETRAWAMGLGIEEMPARQRTIDVVADVLRARDDGLGLGGGKKEGNGEGEPEE